jgi:hypothetical protein
METMWKTWYIEQIINLGINDTLEIVKI